MNSVSAIIPVTILFFVAGCGPEKNQDQEAYQVFSTLFTNYHFCEPLPPDSSSYGHRKFVIKPMTISFNALAEKGRYLTIVKYPKSWFGGKLQRSTFNNYLSMENSRPIVLDRIKFQGKEVAVKEGHVESLGEVTLSQVGFNQARNQALLYMTFTEGPTAGEGLWFLLSKSAGKWVIVDTKQIWVS